jgi:hypothetical protein
MVSEKDKCVIRKLTIIEGVEDVHRILILCPRFEYPENIAKSLAEEQWALEYSHITEEGGEV